MSLTGLASFLATAALYAALASGTLLLLIRRVRSAWLLTFLTFFMIFLALHPFPDREAMVCANAPSPRLVPFAFLGGMSQLIAEQASLRQWATDLLAASTLMNLGLCFLIGTRLPANGIGPGGALIFGALLSGGIELAQLTGLFGFYPCAYRTFDVDDLILNIGGIFLGALLSDILRRRRMRSFG
ncbi:VanZ family protein [Paracoccaceae bacterium GXU_MW_L88]